MSLINLNQKGRIKSKILCKYFILGKCIKGKKCPYLHSQIGRSTNLADRECPMYSIGFCKNGPVCKFSHIKKDNYSNDESEEIMKEEKDNSIEEEEEEEEEEGDEDATSTTPLAEDFINDSETEKEKNNKKNISETYKNNIENNKNNNKNENDFKFHLVPIWYLEYYYSKPISVLFSELEKKNLPEVLSLQKKYGFANDEQNISTVQPFAKKNNFNMNTLNLNFNNFNMNFDFNNNNMSYTPKQRQLYQDIPYKEKDNIFPAPYYSNKDNIEYIINQDKNIYYYLIKCKKYKTIKKSYETSIIKLPEILYNKYKDIDLIINNLSIIIIIFNSEFSDFAGFAKLQYPIIKNNQNDENDNEIISQNIYKIKWLWKDRMNYSEVSHLMNKADNDHFLNEGKNGCPIDKDLGNFICRLMIKRITKEEFTELVNEKKIFENNQIQLKQYLQNFKRYKYDYYDDYQYNNIYYYNNYQFDEKYYYNYNDIMYYNDYDKNIANKNNNEQYNYKSMNKYEDFGYSLKKAHHSHNNHIKKHEHKHNIIDESKYERKKRKKHEKRSRSRSRSRKRKRSHNHSDSHDRRYYRKRESDDYSNYYKHKRYNEKDKKIYSQISKEYTVSKQ